MGKKRLLLKLSGQSLAGSGSNGFDPPTLDALAKEVVELSEEGHEIAIVSGAGNIFRGLQGAAIGVDRVLGDQAGMLATAVNCLVLKSALESHGRSARVLSAFSMHEVCEPYRRERADELLRAGNVVLLAGGTGNPFFTTDSAAALRAAELGADVLLKATRVRGIYTADPERDPEARFLDSLSYDEVIRRDLRVMDTTAFALCRESEIPILVFDLHRSGNIRRAANGEAVGSLVTADGRKRL